MPAPYWTVTRTSGAGGNITNIQAVNMTYGRRVLGTQYAAGTGTIYGRRPDLLPALQVDDILQLTLTNPNSTPASQMVVTARVTDVDVEYGITSALDTYTISFEDASAVAGRARITRTWAAGTETRTAFQDVCTDLGLTYNDVIARAAQTISGITVTNEPALQVLQSIIDTEQGEIGAGGSATSLTFIGNGWQQYMTYKAFSDAGGAATKYDRLQFRSLAENVASFVEVNAAGLSTVTVGTGKYSYAVNTYAPNSTKQTEIGQYIQGALTAQTITPTMISVLLNQETSDRWLAPAGLFSGLQITFRGTTYNTYSIGATITSDVQQTRITYYLANASFYNYLILDNTVYGKLDSNRLAISA